MEVPYMGGRLTSQDHCGCQDVRALSFYGAMHRYVQWGLTWIWCKWRKLWIAINLIFISIFIVIFILCIYIYSYLLYWYLCLYLYLLICISIYIYLFSYYVCFIFILYIDSMLHSYAVSYIITYVSSYDMVKTSIMLYYCVVSSCNFMFILYLSIKGHYITNPNNAWKLP